jgi:Carboxypeptidase regulatory-like domain
MKTIAACAVAVFSIFVISVATAPTIGPVTIDPPQVRAGVATTLRVTASIDDPALIAASPNLQRIDPSGAVTIVGALRDDGTNGDSVAGDRVFTLSFVVNATEAGELRYRVSAAFTGKLRRVFSPALTVVATPGEGVSVQVQGDVVFDSGTPAAGALVSVGLGPSAATSESTTAVAGRTDGDGHFSVTILTGMLPVRVLVQVRTATVPVVDTARWRETDANALDVGTIVLPDARGAAMTISGGAGQTADGSVRVSGLPSNVSQLYARSYDPDAAPQAFPGEFAENGTIPLNSSVFLWAEALTAAGDPVNTFAAPLTFRARVPRTQWIDLEDIRHRTGRIEIPIYTFDETTEMWEQESVGWIEDGSGAVLPEEAETVITSGAFAGEIYATFVTSHLSWMNVDYAFVGPWTLSRMVDRNHRNNDCYYQALQIARRIALSQAGRTAYAQFNTPGADLGRELADGAGPEAIDSTAIGTAYGEFKGNEQGDRDDQLYLNDSLWGGCGDTATAEQKKDTTLIMAVTLLHETAHWKWDVKHEGGAWRNAEPGGEAGNQLERDLFGGIITDGGGLKRDGAPLDAATRDGWLDPLNWPPPASLTRAAEPPRRDIVASPLEIAIALPKTVFMSGEEIPVQVTYRNSSAAPIRIMNTMDLEGSPLWFNAFRDGDTTRVPFVGSRVKRQIDYTRDFVTLAPGGSLVKTVPLLRDPVTAGRRYNFTRSGSFMLTAFYSGLFGIPEATSNVVRFTIGAGGVVAGVVRNASTGLGIVGAIVKALQDGSPVAEVTTGAGGAYTIPELAQGTYTFEASAPGFLRNTLESVAIPGGRTTTLDFALTNLLAAGEVRIVLTWGATPPDLDSHLWLPMEAPFHVYYGRRGVADACPFAVLDTDQTSGFGPETVTIRRRINAGSYVYAVHSFTGTPIAAARGVRVQVFDSTGLIATFEPPITGAGVWWKVFTLDGPTGAITEVNTIGNSPAPYSDVATCAVSVSSDR